MDVAALRRLSTLRTSHMSIAEPLVYGANLEMVHIDTIRESNARGKKLSGLVAVFVGGTGGIGESTAKEFFKRTTKPRAYIIGRWAFGAPLV